MPTRDTAPATAASPVPPEVERFERWLVGERRASPRTVRAYLGDLAGYVAYLGEMGIPIVPSSPVAVRGWLGREAARCGPVSIGRKLSTVRSFYRFLVKERLAPSNPARAVQAPKRPKRLPEVLPEADVAALVEAPADGTPLGLRDRAFLELLYSSGLRVSELVGLDVDELDLQDGLVRVLGKGSKERVVPVGGPAREARRRDRAAGRGRSSSTTGAGASPAARWRAGSRPGPARPACPATYTRTCSATASPRTSSATAPTCGASRSSWDTPR